jgi:hypothetical protein
MARWCAAFHGRNRGSWSEFPRRSCPMGANPCGESGFSRMEREIGGDERTLTAGAVRVWECSCPRKSRGFLGLEAEEPLAAAEVDFDVLDGGLVGPGLEVVRRLELHGGGGVGDKLEERLIEANAGDGEEAVGARVRLDGGDAAVDTFKGTEKLKTFLLAFPDFSSVSRASRRAPDPENGLTLCMLRAAV